VFYVFFGFSFSQISYMTWQSIFFIWALDVFHVDSAEFGAIFAGFGGAMVVTQVCEAIALLMNVAGGLMLWLC